LASGDLGQALKAGFISAVTAGAFQVAGDLTGAFNGALTSAGGHGPLKFLSEAHIFNVASHAAIGCGSAVASGGDCGPGALSGAVGSFTSHLPFAQNLSFEGKLILVSTSGGVASHLGGGKFGNGALTAAFGYLFNELARLPPKGTPVQPHGDQYVPYNELPPGSKDILQYRQFVYDELTDSWWVQFTVPYESELNPTYARRGAGAGTEQSGYVVTPPTSPPFVPGINPQSAIRLGFSTPGFGGPYFVVYNSGGQPISPITGQTVPPARQHYPFNAVKTFLNKP
jgi:hypothetical protein